jgi:nucleoside-diphosphate-sugar epimerase
MQILSIEEEKIDGKTFYVGDEPFNLKEWVDIVADVLIQKKVSVIPAPLVEMLARTGNVLTALGIRFPITTGRYKSMTTNYITPMDKTIRVLGEAPYSVRQGVEEMCKWYNTISARVTAPPPDVPRQKYDHKQPANSARMQPV